MKTISRVYDTYAQARNAVAAVEAAGVPTSEVSLVANKYVSDKYDNVETVRKVDVLVDAIIDHFNTNSLHFVDNSSWSDVTIADEDYPVASDDGSVRHFYATRMTFVVSKGEGRA